LWNRLLEHLHVCPATKHSSLSMLLSPSSQRQNALWGVNEACEKLFQDTKRLSSYNRFQWQWFSHHLCRDKSIVKRRHRYPTDMEIKLDCETDCLKTCLTVLLQNIIHCWCFNHHLHRDKNGLWEGVKWRLTT
jgi:hypothetical protein